MNEKLFTETEAAAFCDLGTKYFKNLRRTGRGPTYVRPSPHMTLYRKSHLETWLKSWSTKMTDMTKTSGPDDNNGPTCEVSND
jgi:hypothetical protein